MWRVKKCRFSVTRISAPTHSAYAAIKASAGFRPLDSYFAPNSNGTEKSSSIEVNSDMNLINSRKISGVKWFLTSSTLNRGMRKVCAGNFSTNVSSKDLELVSLEDPKASIYSFESMTRSKFFLPEGLSCFAQCLNNFFLTLQAKNRRRVLSYNLSYFSQMLFSLVDVRFCHGITSILSLPHLEGGVNHREKCRGEDTPVPIAAWE